MDETSSSELPLQISPPPERPPLQPPLSGPSGVGWGFLLYLLMLFIVAAISLTVLRFLLPAKMPQIWKSVMGEVAYIVSAFIPGFIMARIERRPFAAYGLPKERAFGRLFWLGMLWGIVALTVLMLMMRIAGVFHFGALALGGFRIVKFAVFWVVFFVVVGLFEEFLLRGYTQFTLSRGLGFWPTALILSFAFGAIHLGNQGEDKVGALGAAIIGLFFCLTLKYTGNLWFAVGLHASWDWGETFLYSVPNSGFVAPGHLLNSWFEGPKWLTGGSVGPEASIFVFIVMALMAVLFHFLYKPVKKRVEAGLAPPATPVAYQE
jgi:hypothetical protein